MTATVPTTIEMQRVTGRFARAEPRHRVGKFIRGLLADLPRKNCWTIAKS